MDEPQPLSFTLNGRPTRLEVDLATPLLDILRDRLGLRGPKEGCRVGYCGACTVLLDGMAVHSCCVLGAQVAERAVETIESTAPDIEALGAAFVAENAVQCGVCIPGMIMTSAGVLRSCPDAADEAESAVYDHLLGNICRCGGYSRIKAAALSVLRARQP